VEFPAQEEVAQAALDAFLNERSRLIDQYEALEPRPGLTVDQEARILDVDKAKELFPFVAENQESRARYGGTVYPVAVKLIQQLYWRRLDLGKEGDEITFTGGGAGTGKSALVTQNFSPLAAQGQLPCALVDGTLADYIRTLEQISLAQSRRFAVKIWFIFRNFESVARGFIDRAAAIGRTMPMGRVAVSHHEAARSLRKLVADQVVPREDILVFEMTRASEGEPGFVPATLNSVLRAAEQSSLEQKVETAYKILQNMRSTLPDYVYEQLSRR
jgi:hypothetical protein